jgi:hypothetical protein
MMVNISLFLFPWLLLMAYSHNILRMLVSILTKVKLMKVFGYFNHLVFNIFGYIAMEHPYLDAPVA